LEINCRNVYKCLNNGECEQLVCGNFSILDKKINCPIFLNSKNNKIEYSLKIYTTNIDKLKDIV
jgi:hypothetical protein